MKTLLIILITAFTIVCSIQAQENGSTMEYNNTEREIPLKVGSINSIFYFLHKAAEPFNCLEQDNLA